jgi:hypothetical protein
MGGPMAGTRLVIDAVDEVLVGSDPDCRLSLDLPGVSPIHARVWRDLGGITVYDTRSPRGIYVNDTRVADQAALHDGDVLWLGPPGDADSVMIQCRLPEEGVLGAPVGEVVSDAPPADSAFTAPPEETLPDPILAEPPATTIDGWEDAPAEEPAIEAHHDLLEAHHDLPVNEPEDLVADLPAATPAPEPEPPAETAADDAAWLLDAAPPASPAPTIEPQLEAELPAPPVPAAEPEAFVMDPAWGEPDEPAAAAEVVPEPAPPSIPSAPIDIDSLLGDAAAAEEALPTSAAPTPPPAPHFDEAPIALAAVTPPPMTAPPSKPPEPVVAPADADAAPPVTPRQVGGVPPLTPAPARTGMDDTSPRPAPRKPAAPPRHGAPEGVMDWAKSTPSSEPDEVPAPPPVRPASRAPRPAARTGRGPLLPVAGGLLLLAALAGGYFVWRGSGTPRIDAVRPTRVTAGNTLTLTGANLGEAAGGTSVSVGGRPARVVRTAGTQVEIEIPEVPTTPGRDTSVPIVLTTGGRESAPIDVAVYQAPRLRSLAPDVAMPGQDVVLTGTSLGPGATVRFGDVEAQVVSAAAGSLTVKVPALPGAPGKEYPVVASAGADPSNALTFVVGKVPLVTGMEPRSASPGDLVTVVGRGFDPTPTANRVRVGGTSALVVTSGPRGLEFVVPRVIAGEGTVSITVPGSTNVGQEEMSITVLPEPIGFRFVAEPFEDVPGHEHAAVATGLGPAFILTTSQGKPAAERAYEAQKKLNDAGQVLRSTRTAEIRARYEPAPEVYLVTRDGVLLEATAADAEAYNEDWTKSRRGAPVTRERLATWWEAVARDLVLLLLRGEKPEHAVALAAEGKVFADLHDAARRSIAVGVPTALVAEPRSPMREALRAVALRVPATVTAPVAGGGAAPATADSVPPLRLMGSWRGSEIESGVQKPITVVFRGNSGTLTYERALSMSVPVLAVQQPQKGAVHFEVRVGSGTRFYRGRWDGSRITGKLTSDSAGRTEVGTFELEPPG